MYCCMAAVPVAAVGPRELQSTVTWLFFTLFTAALLHGTASISLPAWTCLITSISASHSAERERERERERGRRWTGTGNTRTGEERRLERNEFGCGTLSKSVLTRDEKVFSVEISASVYIYLKQDGQRRTNQHLTCSMSLLYIRNYVSERSKQLLQPPAHQTRTCTRTDTHTCSLAVLVFA